MKFTFFYYIVEVYVIIEIIGIVYGGSIWVK